MKLHTKSFIYLALIFIMSVIACTAIIWTTFSGYKDELNKDRNEEVQGIVQYSFDNIEQNLNNLLTNHAYWTDVDLHLAAKNYTWLKDNVTAYLAFNTTYSIDLLYFRSDRHHYQEFYGNVPVKSVELLQVNQDIRQGKMLTHQFAIIANEVYLIVASPITDNEQKHPDGVFILGKHINNKAIEQLAGLMHAEGISTIGIEISRWPASSTFTTLPNGLHKFNYLLAHEKEKFAYLTVVTTDQSIEALVKDTQRNVIWAVIVTFMLSMLIAYALFYRTSQNIYASVSIINEIAGGHYDKRMNLRTSEEFKQLSFSVNKLTSDFQGTLNQLNDHYLEIISMMIKVIEVTDHYTRGHSERVSHYAVAIAKEMGYEDIETIRISGLMHDIGKIAIDGNILNKVGELTESEFEWIKSHPVIAYKILDLSNLFAHSKEIILCHHEYYNGKGYPNGLASDAIPLGARILGVADAFDAMTSNRSYRPAINLVRAIEIIRNESGGQFDPDVVAAFDTIALRIYSEWSSIENSPSLEELFLSKTQS